MRSIKRCLTEPVHSRQDSCGMVRVARWAAVRSRVILTTLFPGEAWGLSLYSSCCEVLYVESGH